MMFSQILFQPKDFDSNEYFILTAGLLIMFLTLLLPRRISLVEIIVIWATNYLMAEIADFSIGRPPIDWYDFNDHPKYEYFDIILYLFLYPPVAYLFIHFYDKWKLEGLPLAFFIGIFALLTTCLEGIASMFHVFTYKGWHLVYSFPSYILIFIINLSVFRFVRKYSRA